MTSYRALLIASGFLLTSFILQFSPARVTITPYEFPDLSHFPSMPVSVNNPTTVEGVELGRYLFYDSTLSNDYTFSCASCHQQKYAFSDGPKKFSLGIHQKKLSRNTLPLFNLAWYDAYFWDGKANSIENQVFFPVRCRDEMDLSWDDVVKRISKSKFYREKFYAAFGTYQIDSVSITNAIAQFERTLISHNSKFDRALKRQEHLNESEYRGFVLMNDQSMADCLHCHPTDASILGTTGSFSNNGLDNMANMTDIGLAGISYNKTDQGKFKIPSLRNLGFTSPYMHDGRFSNLREVLDFYSDGVQMNPTIDSKMTRASVGGVHLTEQEKDDIIAFLLTMNDSTFIKNPNFSNPWHEK